MNHMLVLEFYQLDELLMVTVHGSGNLAHTTENKGVDVALAIDLLLYGLVEPENGGYDVAVLVSGDRDFVAVIEVLKQRRPACAVEVAQFTSNAGQELRDAARAFYPLEDYADKFGNWIQKHSG